MYVYLRHHEFVKGYVDLTRFRRCARMLPGLAGKDVVDRHEGLLADLEATFSASIARNEDEAADDLAIGLRADGALEETLTSRGVDVIVDGERTPVRTVATDHVIAGTTLISFGAGSFVVTAGPRPRASNQSLQQTLHACARVRKVVEISLRDRRISGRLLVAGRDHVLVASEVGDQIVSLDAVVWVRLSPEDSTGAP